MSAANFPGRLREERERAGLTQKQLADKAGLGLRVVTYYEGGKREPTWSNLLALADALGVSCEAFTTRPSQREQPQRGRPRKPAEAKPAKRKRKK